MFKKNTAVVGFCIGHFINATTNEAVITGVPTCKRCIDGTWAACDNAATAPADATEGWQIILSADDMNGDVIGLSFTLTDCLPISYTITTVENTTDDLTSINAKVDAVALQTDKLQFTTGNFVQANVASSTPVAGIDFVYTVTDSATGQPLSGARVLVYADAAGTQLIAASYTNALGVASFKIDAAAGTTLYVGVLKSGYSEFSTLDEETL